MKIQYPCGEGIREKDSGLGQNLFPDEVLLLLTGSALQTVPCVFYGFVNTGDGSMCQHVSAQRTVPCALSVIFT